MTNKYPDATMIAADFDTLGLKNNRSDLSCLVMIYGEYLGRRFQIKNIPVEIGRSPECKIQLSDDYVSRRHCRLVPGDNGVFLQDLDSTNGTFINGLSAAEKVLNDGDSIRLGRSIFKFLTGDNIEHAYHEEIYRLKTTDCLTGAYNKRYFEETLERELNRFHRYKGPLSMLMMDIDHFKRINDDHGHLAGDQVLAKLGEVVMAKVRLEDSFCRYGGEEFALLMPEMEFGKAIELAERIRGLIEETVFEFEALELPVTVSIGVATAGESTKKPDDLIKVADDRLYQAKHNGRNCVVPQPLR